MAEAGKAKTVFPVRLGGMNISASRILYAGKNNVGEIDELIVEDLTGDMHDYGIVTAAKRNSGGMAVSGTYTYLINGIEKTLSVSNQSYSVTAGQPVQIKTAANGSVTALIALNQAASGKASELSGATIRVGGNTYQLSDNVSIYTKDASYNYSMLTKEELESSLSDYNITLYRDKAESAGGRIRVIIAVPKV